MRTLFIPPGPQGEKVGVDDFLAAGGTLAKLLEADESAVAPAFTTLTSTSGSGPAHPYKFTDHGTEMTKYMKGVPYDVRLANFRAEIEEDVNLDDGVESNRHYVIKVSLDGKEVRTAVPASEFPMLGWLHGKLGARAIVGPGAGIQDNLRAAIQYLSTPKTVNGYGHVGFRIIDGVPHYLHAGGAIAPDGHRNDVTVVVPRELCHYELPDPASVDLKNSFQALLRLLKALGPVRAWRLLALVFLAILADLIPPDFVAWLRGKTGTFKSTIAALISCFFGLFDRLTLPGNLKSTANATEALAFCAKDVVFVVDDFAPSSGQGAHQAQEQTVFKLIRAVGDRHARNRMRADRSVVGEKPPRGLVLVTAELPPPAGQSTQARCFEIAWDNVGVDFEALRWAEENDRPHYAGLSACFIQDVARHYETLRKQLPSRVRDLRARFAASHRRVAETATKLIVAIETFLDFAYRSELVTERERAEYLAAATEAIASAAESSSEAETDRSPVSLLFEGLRTAFGLQQAHLDDAGVQAGPPATNPERWGYVNQTVGRFSTLVGWIDAEKDLVYLSPAAAIRCATRALNDYAGLPQNTRAVGDLLKGEKRLRQTDHNRSTVVVKVGATRQRVWAMSAKDFQYDDTVTTVTTVPEGADPVPEADYGRHGTVHAPDLDGDDGDDPEGSGGFSAPPSPSVASSASEGTSQALRAVTPSLGGFSHSNVASGLQTASLASLEVSPVLVSTPEGVASLLGRLRSHEGPVGLDVETTGLNPRKDRVRLLQVALGEEVFVVDAFATPVAPLLPTLAERELVGHNLLFDLSFLRGPGLEPKSVFDTMLATQVLESGDRHPDGRSLRAVVARELGLLLPKETQLSDWTGTLTREQVEYAARDARSVLLLRERLKGRLEREGLTRVTDIENRCLPALVWMNLQGVPLDENAWRKENTADRVSLEEARVALEGHLHGLLPGRQVNWRSPQQVIRLFADLGAAVDSTRADVLSRLDHPLAKAITKLNHINHRVGAWGSQKFWECVEGGRVYPEWHQIGADSGRMSCRNPNLQAIPRHGYKDLIRPSEGMVLVDADYSQIELRLGAKIAREPRLIRLFQGGVDLHTETARLVTKKVEVTREERSHAKACNFGFLFGMGAARFRDYARNDYGVDLSEGQAQVFRERFFAAYPGLRAWHQRVGASRARDTRTLAGRRRFVRQTDFTARVNTPVQGSCADGLKQALALLWERRREQPGAVPVLAVHDQIVVETTPERAEEVKSWLRAAMEDGMREFTDPVPVKVDTHVVAFEPHEEEDE